MIENLSPTETLNHKDLLNYKNSKIPVDDRVASLLNHMTRKERAVQMLSGCPKTDSIYLINIIYCGQGPQLTHIWLEAVPESKFSESLLCVWRLSKPILFNEEGNLDFVNLECHFKHSIGQIARLSDRGGGISARDIVELTDTFQKFFVEKTRLGISMMRTQARTPEKWMN